jgi:hypothetical protein
MMSAQIVLGSPRLSPIGIMEPGMIGIMAPRKVA